MVLVLDINLTPPQEQDDGGTVLDLNFTSQEDDGQEAHIPGAENAHIHRVGEEDAQIPAGTPLMLYFRHITVNLHI
jgi:3-mercaptopyruvate sulfurtransferase SseA